MHGYLTLEAVVAVFIFIFIIFFLILISIFIFVLYTWSLTRARRRAHYMESHLRFTIIITSNTIVKCLNASLSNFISSRNVAANLIASLKKCYAFACVNQRRTCKRIPSTPRCLFRPSIVIYAYLVTFLICMLFK